MNSVRSIHGLPIRIESSIRPPPIKAGAMYKWQGATVLAEPVSKAEKLLLSGTVRSVDCKPLAGVKLDFWHADASGAYDNQGYKYRGVLTTDAEGRYRLETNLPPPYPRRDPATQRQDALHPALVPALKRPGNVGHALTRPPGFPEFGLLLRRKPDPCNLRHTHPYPARLEGVASIG